LNNLSIDKLNRLSKNYTYYPAYAKEELINLTSDELRIRNKQIIEKIKKTINKEDDQLTPDERAKDEQAYAEMKEVGIDLFAEIPVSTQSLFLQLNLKKIIELLTKDIKVSADSTPEWKTQKTQEAFDSENGMFGRNINKSKKKKGTFGRL
jgi:hypothetical protein